MNRNDIPNTWEWVTLDEISNKITDGSHNPPRGIGEGIPMLSAKNIQNNFINFSDVRYISAEDYELENSRTNLMPDDVLLTTVGTIGRVALVPKENSNFLLQRSVTVIKPLIYPKYLLYYFLSSDFQKTLIDHSSGTAQKGIYLNILKTLKIPLAPSEEQLRIVKRIEDLLNEINESKKTIIETLKNVDLYLDKTIFNAFKGSLVLDEEALRNLPENWKWVTLNDIGLIVSGGTPSTKKVEFWGEEVPWITPSDLSKYEEKYISKGKRGITKDGLKNSSATIIPSGSILFSSRAPIGYVAIAKNDLATNQGFKNIVPNKGMNNSYIYYYLKSIKEYANSIASGTTFLELSATKFKQIPFPLAPFEDQNMIVDEIELAVSHRNMLKNELHQKLAYTKQLTDKLLQSAYQGKLSKQLSSDTPLEELLKNIKIKKIDFDKNQKIIQKKKKSSANATKIIEVDVYDFLVSNYRNKLFSYSDLYNNLNLSREILLRQFEILEKNKSVTEIFDTISGTVKYKLS